MLKRLFFCIFSAKLAVYSETEKISLWEHANFVLIIYIFKRSAIDVLFINLINVSALLVSVFQTSQLAQLLGLCCPCERCGFESRVGHIGHNVANDSPPLRRLFVAVLPRR